MNYKRLVKKLREAHCYSNGIGGDFGVSFASINRWETGKHEPTKKAKRKIVALYKENDIKLEEENNG